MLQLLKETVSSRHAERLEQIVIALIGVEIGIDNPFPKKRVSALTLHLRVQYWVSSPSLWIYSHKRILEHHITDSIPGSVNIMIIP